MDYLDFDVEIGLGLGRDYPVSVRSPAGQAHGSMRFPYDTLELENALLKLKNALLSSGGTRRKALTESEKAVQVFGQRLFEALLADDLRSLFYESKREAARLRKSGLRLRLHIRAPELAGLPWEYLYDPRLSDYLCLSQKTPLVRYLDLAHPMEPLLIVPPLRILAMTASPSDQDELNMEREQERMRQALGPLELQGQVALTWLPGQTARDLHRALQRGPWHVFHFMGHGDFDARQKEGVLALANEQGKTALLYATQLARLLADHDTLRLAILNSCNGAKGGRQDIFSSTAATLARFGLPAVLAMQEEITDNAATEWTRAFYEALATGLPVDAAAAEARLALTYAVNNSLEWGTPVLYLRAPDSTLFSLTQTGVPVQKEASPDGALGSRTTSEALLHKERAQKITASADQPPVPTPKKRARPAPFPPVWNVPYRYSFFFTGRDRQVEHLFETFTAEYTAGAAPVQALSGLGGLGKTQTAVEYAYRYRQQYQAVLWMRAETEADLLASFKSSAELLQRPPTHIQQRESLLASMSEWFRTTADWLLILDNADNLALVEPFLPTSAQGHILLTTRAAALGTLAQPLALTPLTPEDGALCLLRRAKNVPLTGQLSEASSASVKAALELTQRMDGLPLALEQAGAYIESTGRSVSGYLDLYRRYRPEIQSHQQGPVPNYREPVAFAWNIASETVQLKNEAAIDLLHLCAYLAPEAIPYELFTHGAPALGPTLGPVADDPLALDGVISLLREHSLLKNEVDRETDTSRLNIHSVIQEILQDNMGLAAQQLWAQRAVSAVAYALPVVEWQLMQAHARRCLSLIEHWKMSFPEADLIRQRVAAEDL